MDTKKGYDIKYILILAILGFLLVSRLFFDGFIFGYRTAFVLTNSMEPKIPVGAILIEEKYPEKMQVKLKTGDIITFKIRDGESTMRVTHRIIKIQDGKIYTKGDNNPDRDPWSVMKDQVEGRVVYVFSF